MAIAKNLQTLLTNGAIRREFAQWTVSKALHGRPPRIALPGGHTLSPADRFNDFHSIAKQHPGPEELKLLSVLMNYGPRNGIFVDVGANVGAVSLLAHSTGLAARIEAF